MFQFAKDLGFVQSLFARVIQNFEGGDNSIRMLRTQYRMHPEISLYPNYTFYNEQLIDSPICYDRKCFDALIPYCIFNLNLNMHQNYEYLNTEEANFVLTILQAIDYVVRDISSYSVGIITPYSKQKDMILNKLKDAR